MKKTIKLFKIPHTLSPQQKTDYFSLLSTAEKKRWQSISNPKRRVEYLVSHARLYQLLKKCYPTAQLVFLKSGAPIVKGIKNCYVSLSHSDNLGMIGIAHSPLGIDLQKMKSLSPLKQKQLAQRFFGITKSLTKKEFYREWVLYECHFKAQIKQNEKYSRRIWIYKKAWMAGWVVKK